MIYKPLNNSDWREIGSKHIYTHQRLNQFQATRLGIVYNANPIILKRGIEKATQYVLRRITEYARPIEKISDIDKVSTNLLTERSSLENRILYIDQVGN